MDNSMNHLKKISNPPRKNFCSPTGKIHGILETVSTSLEDSPKEGYRTYCSYGKDFPLSEKYHFNGKLVDSEKYPIDCWNCRRTIYFF